MKYARVFVCIALISLLAGARIAAADREGRDNPPPFQMAASTTPRFMPQLNFLGKIKDFLLKKPAPKEASSTPEREDRAEKPRADNRFGPMISRFSDTIKRLRDILSRLNSRIDKIKAAGGDTMNAQKLAVDADHNLTQAEGLFATLGDLASTTAAAENTASSTFLKLPMKNLKKTSESIAAYLQKAQNDMERATALLRKQASTTPGTVSASSTISH